MRLRIEHFVVLALGVAGLHCSHAIGHTASLSPPRAASSPLTPPEVLEAPRLRIPADMKQAGCTPGDAVVGAFVGVDGRVFRTWMLKESGTPRFDQVCLANAHRWTFDPGRLMGVATEATTVITCHLDCH